MYVALQFSRCQRMHDPQAPSDAYAVVFAALSWSLGRSLILLADVLVVGVQTDQSTRGKSQLGCKIPVTAYCFLRRSHRSDRLAELNWAGRGDLGADATTDDAVTDALKR